jgi:hypothetical protein
VLVQKDPDASRNGRRHRGLILESRQDHTSRGSCFLAGLLRRRDYSLADSRGSGFPYLMRRTVEAGERDRDLLPLGRELRAVRCRAGCHVPGKERIGQTNVLQALYRVNPVEQLGLDEVVDFPAKLTRRRRD